ncbi:MAG: efflux RND transporter periplasmic adaptor subunit [Francisellaceae bacterium]|nr:efflux RND transporter periplasmic adaptor subunit [Francisellaceae bacterium]MBT6207806.1 efflux RND transporter periplasmic adaptor subunit [Francisellaceae bacterium]MBT6537986.1 efflux RND transporter periplasmic adaptor subunit [Francisellaceae bacterium]
MPIDSELIVEKHGKKYIVVNPNMTEMSAFCMEGTKPGQWKVELDIPQYEGNASRPGKYEAPSVYHALWAQFAAMRLAELQEEEKATGAKKLEIALKMEMFKDFLSDLLTVPKDGSPLTYIEVSKLLEGQCKKQLDFHMEMNRFNSPEIFRNIVGKVYIDLFNTNESLQDIANEIYQGKIHVFIESSHDGQPYASNYIDTMIQQLASENKDCEVSLEFLNDTDMLLMEAQERMLDSEHIGSDLLTGEAVAAQMKRFQRLKEQTNTSRVQARQSSAQAVTREDEVNEKLKALKKLLESRDSGDVSTGNEAERKERIKQGLEALQARLKSKSEPSEPLTQDRKERAQQKLEALQARLKNKAEPSDGDRRERVQQELEALQAKLKNKAESSEASLSEDRSERVNQELSALQARLQGDLAKDSISVGLRDSAISTRRRRGEVGSSERIKVVKDEAEHDITASEAGTYVLGGQQSAPGYTHDFNSFTTHIPKSHGMNQPKVDNLYATTGNVNIRKWNDVKMSTQSHITETIDNISNGDLESKNSLIYAVNKDIDKTRDFYAALEVTSSDNALIVKGKNVNEANGSEFELLVEYDTRTNEITQQISGNYEPSDNEIFLAIQMQKQIAMTTKNKEFVIDGKVEASTIMKCVQMANAIGLEPKLDVNARLVVLTDLEKNGVQEKDMQSELDKFMNDKGLYQDDQRILDLKLEDSISIAKRHRANRS